MLSLIRLSSRDQFYFSILSSNTRLIENTFISNHEIERKKLSLDTCDWQDFSCPPDRQNCLFELMLYGTSLYAVLSLHFMVNGLFYLLHETYLSRLSCSKLL